MDSNQSVKQQQQHWFQVSYLNFYILQRYSDFIRSTLKNVTNRFSIITSVSYEICLYYAVELWSEARMDIQCDLFSIFIYSLHRSSLVIYLQNMDIKHWLCWLINYATIWFIGKQYPKNGYLHCIHLRSRLMRQYHFTLS